MTSSITRFTYVAIVGAVAAACSSDTSGNGGGSPASATATGAAGSTSTTTVGPTSTVGAGGSTSTTGSSSTTATGGVGGTASGSGGSTGSGGTPKMDAGGGAGGDVRPPDGGDSGGRSDAAADVGGMPPGGLAPTGGACPPGATYGAPLPQVKSATMVKGGFGELEGPLWVASQHALYFCEMGSSSTTGHIHKYTPADGNVVTFVDNVGVGGLALDPQGMIVAASYDKRRLTRFDPATGQRVDVPGGSMYMGQPFDEVNDVVVRSDGNMYFSDPNFAQPAGMQQPAFYRLSPPPQSTVTRIITANNANGIALSPDGGFLYLATTGGPALRRIQLAADGSPMGSGVVWNEPTSDGMAVDCAGNLYLSVADATNHIDVVSSTDQALGSIVGLGGGYVTNSAFGDDDRQTLYITTSTTLFKIRLNVPGFPN